MISQTFLIELDACLDTRLGTLSQISHDGVMAVMRNGYWGRDTDDFETLSGGLITNEQFAAKYATRDVETLKASMMTQLFDVIGPMTKELQRQQSMQVEIGDINVVINFFPYQLDDDVKRTLLDAMTPYLAINTRLKAAYIPLTQLHPTDIEGLADIAIIYHYNDWMTHWLNELPANKIPMMTMMVPKLLHNKAAMTEDIIRDPETGELRDPFELHTLVMAEFLAIEFQPVNVFSSIC
jgi:hypothetical protein